MNIEVLINKNNILDKDYVPNDLVVMDDNTYNFHNYIDSSLKPMISKLIYKDFIDMQNDALKLGYKIIVDSGYRSYLYQVKLWNKSIISNGYDHTKKYTAFPGTSEHQSGLAIDVAYIRDNKYFDDIKGIEEETIWLHNNSYKYGFILRYPKCKENITGYSYEPWHFRYVGKSLANYLYINNKTIEEYYMK